MIFDGHSDLLYDVARRRLRGETRVLERRHVDRLRRGGIEGLVLALWVSVEDDSFWMELGENLPDAAGRVELLLTTTGSDETFYQTDVRRSGETSEETTVFSANQSAQKTPVVTKTKKASYAGAVVVCDGADSAVVRLRIVQAVSALTGLGSDKISVIKMKQS